MVSTSTQQIASGTDLSSITEAPAFKFDSLSLLITHYNRSQSLERLLAAFKKLKCEFGSIVVSDDGSKPPHLPYVKELQKTYNFELITTDKNKGLGNNINKGQDATKTPYVLYVQEDFIPTEMFPVKLAEALTVMDGRKDIDMVRFYSYFKYPHLKPLSNGFSEMQFNLFLPGYKKFYYYSDHPHLRRSNFFEKFGRYREGLNPERTEYYMMMNFLQKKGKGIYYNEHKQLFVQSNSKSEPSTVRKNFWRKSDNSLVFLLREAYRHLRFNMDYLIRRAGIVR